MEEKRSDSSTDGDAQHNDDQKRHGFHFKDAFIGVIEAAVGGGFFSLLGELLDFFGFHGLKIWCLFAGFASVEFALAHLLVKVFRKKAKVVWFTYAAVVVLELALFVLSNSNPRESQLRLYLKTSDTPNDVLLFTNKFLFLDPERLSLGPEKFATNGPILVVGVPIGNTNSTLRFGVGNIVKDKFPKPEDDAALTAELAEATIFLFPSEPLGRLTWQADKEWKTDRVKLGTSQHLYFRLPPILPGEGESCPPITFTMPTGRPEQILVMVAIRARGMEMVFVAFKLALIRSLSPIAPHFETNSIIVMYAE